MTDRRSVVLAPLASMPAGRDVAWEGFNERPNEHKSIGVMDEELTYRTFVLIAVVKTELPQNHL